MAKPKGRNAKTEPGTKSAKVETVEQKIVSAVKDVAETLGGNKKQTESELLNRLISNDEQLPSANLRYYWILYKRFLLIELYLHINLYFLVILSVV